MNTEDVMQPLTETLAQFGRLRELARREAQTALAGDAFRRSHDLVTLTVGIVKVIDDLGPIAVRWEELAAQATELGLLQQPMAMGDCNPITEPQQPPVPPSQPATPDAPDDDAPERHAEITDREIRDQATEAAVRAFMTEMDIAEMLPVPRKQAIRHTPDRRIGLTVMYSKHYPDQDNYWYALHPRQASVLAEFSETYHLFVLGDSGVVAVIAGEALEQNLPELPTTVPKSGPADRYWHIKLRPDDNSVALLRKRPQPPMTGIVKTLRTTANGEQLPEVG